MSELKLIWSERSIKEYKALLDYLYSEWGEKITLEVIERIEQSVNRIQKTPEQFPFIVKTKSIRRCVMSPQTSIFFRVSDFGVEVLSLFDNRQDPKKRRLQ